MKRCLSPASSFSKVFFPRPQSLREGLGIESTATALKASRVTVPGATAFSQTGVREDKKNRLLSIESDVWGGGVYAFEISPSNRHLSLSGAGYITDPHRTAKLRNLFC